MTTSRYLLSTVSSHYATAITIRATRVQIGFWFDSLTKVIHKFCYYVIISLFTIFMLILLLLVFKAILIARLLATTLG
jgi:hypothetical protein